MSISPERPTFGKASRQSTGLWSGRARRDSVESAFDHTRGPLPPIFDFTAVGRKDETVFHFSQYIQAALSTGLFRIWPSLLVLTSWAVAVTCINKFTEVDFIINNGLLGIFGTVLGFVISYRTASAYDRYWSGRTLWSNVALACRQWSRCVWISCPDATVKTPSEDPVEQTRDSVRAVVEKRSMINLALAFSVSLKHYLRGEEGVYYEDLWWIVKHLPGLNMPSTVPLEPGVGPEIFSDPESVALDSLPYKAPTTSANEKYGTTSTSATKTSTCSTASLPNGSPSSRPQCSHTPSLRPARNPPPDWKLRDIWPFYLLRQRSAKDLARLESRREIKERQKRGTVSHNVPLELLLYMQAYVAALTKRDTVDPLTRGNMNTAIQSLADSLTSLERVLTTPLPFAYQAHIWTVAVIYLLLLPPQIITAFSWLTIPATSIIGFLFLGFLSVGDEIENPFGYDRNDLNLDQFNNLIRAELAAVTSRPMPTIESWVFSRENDSIFGEDAHNSTNACQLVEGGMQSLRKSLAALGGVDPNPQSQEGLRHRGAATHTQQEQMGQGGGGDRVDVEA